MGLSEAPARTKENGMRRGHSLGQDEQRESDDDDGLEDQEDGPEAVERKVEGKDGGNQIEEGFIGEQEHGDRRLKKESFRHPEEPILGILRMNTTHPRVRVTWVAMTRKATILQKNSQLSREI